MKTRWRLLICLIFGFILGACSSSQDVRQIGAAAPTLSETSTEPPDPTKIAVFLTPTTEKQAASITPTEGTSDPMPAYLPTPTNSDLQSLVELAQKDLGARLSIPSDQISLVEVSQVTWSDSSLGCPQPDMAYTQVLTPGYLVVLKSGDRQFEYHAGQDKSLFFCKNPLPPSAGSPGNT